MPENNIFFFFSLMHAINQNTDGIRFFIAVHKILCRCPIKDCLEFMMNHYIYDKANTYTHI